LKHEIAGEVAKDLIITLFKVQVFKGSRSDFRAGPKIEDVQGSSVQAFKVGFGGDEDGMGSFKLQGSSVQGQISGQGPK
jgi:hypothetical protein